MRWLIFAAVIATVRIAGLNESSGLASSRLHPGVFWTLNDGPARHLYAIDRKGLLRARVRLDGFRPVDVEGLAIGSGPGGGFHLFIGDIGDNLRTRKSIAVYRIPEPGLSKEGESATPEVFRFTYPDGPHDAEALLVHPQSGDLYIVSKARGDDTDTGVYKAAAPHLPGRTRTLKRVAKLEFPGDSPLTLLIGRVTGGDISPDGRYVILCGYIRAWEAAVPAGPDFDAVWNSKWTPVDLDKRVQGEAIAYSHDGRTLLATSEGEEFPLIEVTPSR